MSQTASSKEAKTRDSANTPTALVAGGAGFVGSHLCATLISQNFKVICVDNLSSGKKENIKEILTSANFTFIEADINNPNFALPEDLKIDYCFHLAGIEEYQNKDNLSLDTLLVNSLGTRQILEIAKANSAKFILASSADLYSGAISSSSLRYYFGKTPIGEAVLSVHEAKRFAEALSFEYFRKYGLQVTILRLKDIFGPKMDLERGDDLSQILKAAARKDTIKISGDGLKTINPTYITDVVFGMVKASVGDFSGEIFILVNPEKITVESFAQTVKLVAGPVEIEHKKENETLEIPTPHLDLDNTKEKISWRPKVTLAEGISSVIQSLRMGEIQEQNQIQAEPVEVTTKELGVKEVTKNVDSSRPKAKYGKLIRVTIFLASLLLLIVTIVYPLSAVGLGSYFGSQNLVSAENALEANNTKQAVNKAYSAQNSFISAEKNLLYISWLLKIIGLAEKSANFDHLLTAADKLTQSIRSTARANEILVETADRPDLNRQIAEQNLNKSLDELYASLDQLDAVVSILDNLDWNSIPVLIAPDRDFIYQTTVSLQKQADNLIATINSTLGKTSD